MEKKKVSFFLGANTPEGFVSEFGELYNPHEDALAYIIKGGPGCGKSSLMKKAAKLCEDMGFYTERIICSSDPSSLDGISVPALKFCIADGTPPHTLEPRFPGAVERLIDMGQCWNADILRGRAEEIRRISEECSEYHRRSVRFLGAACSLRGDTARILSGNLLTEKAENYAARFAARELGREAKKRGREYRRFLSALAPSGFFTCTDTVEALCGRVIVIDDEHSLAAPYLLNLIKEQALAAGLDVISCLNPLKGGRTLSHLIIPERGLCLFTSNSLHSSSFMPYRRVNCRRFLKEGCMKPHRSRITFNSKASAELMNEAAELMRVAKRSHDALEKIYISAMDFSKADKQCEEVLEEIKKRAKTR